MTCDDTPPNPFLRTKKKNKTQAQRERFESGAKTLTSKNEAAKILQIKSSLSDLPILEKVFLDRMSHFDQMELVSILIIRMGS